MRGERRAIYELIEFLAKLIYDVTDTLSLLSRRRVEAADQRTTRRGSVIETRIMQKFTRRKRLLLPSSLSFSVALNKIDFP